MIQINLPDSATQRWGHSLSAYIMGSHCVWLFVIGGSVIYSGPYVTNPNITMVIELSK